MTTRQQLLTTAAALIAGAMLCTAASAQAEGGFQPAFPIVQDNSAPAPAPQGAFDGSGVYHLAPDADNPPPAAQPDGPPPEPMRDAPTTVPDSKAYSAGAVAADIAMQPAKDIGVKKTEIPPALIAAQSSPYAMADAANCQRMTQALAELDEALGPDYAVERVNNENKTAKVAEAGGRAIVNSIIPFRGIVREVTGAAAADRAYAAAVDAGIAKRGFLRGLSTAQGCASGQQQASLGR